MSSLLGILYASKHFHCPTRIPTYLNRQHKFWKSYHHSHWQLTSDWRCWRVFIESCGIQWSKCVLCQDENQRTDAMKCSLIFGFPLKKQTTCGYSWNDSWSCSPSTFSITCRKNPLGRAAPGKKKGWQPCLFLICSAAYLWGGSGSGYFDRKKKAKVKQPKWREYFYGNLPVAWNQAGIWCGSDMIGVVVGDVTSEEVCGHGRNKDRGSSSVEVAATHDGLVKTGVLINGQVLWNRRLIMKQQWSSLIIIPPIFWWSHTLFDDLRPHATGIPPQIQWLGKRPDPPRPEIPAMWSGSRVEATKVGPRSTTELKSPMIFVMKSLSWCFDSGLRQVDSKVAMLKHWPQISQLAQVLIFDSSISIFPHWRAWKGCKDMQCVHKSGIHEGFLLFPGCVSQETTWWERLSEIYLECFTEQVRKEPGWSHWTASRRGEEGIESHESHESQKMHSNLHGLCTLPTAYLCAVTSSEYACEWLGAAITAYRVQLRIVSLKHMAFVAWEPRMSPSKPLCAHIAKRRFAIGWCVCHQLIAYGYSKWIKMVPCCESEVSTLMQTALTSRRHGWIDGSFGVVSRRVQKGRVGHHPMPG